MNLLLLSEKKNDEFVSFLSERGEVNWSKDIINAKLVSNYDWIISYGYRHIISNDIINKSKNQIINLHISYLPYNRGSDPNYWSFKDKTPKGVTIHFIDEGIDSGPILVQRLCSFDSSYTLKTSYIFLKKTIETLFYDNFDKIINGEIKPKPQIGEGTIHYKKDLQTPLNYNTYIDEI